MGGGTGPGRELRNDARVRGDGAIEDGLTQLSAGRPACPVISSERDPAGLVSILRTLMAPPTSPNAPFPCPHQPSPPFPRAPIYHFPFRAKLASEGKAPNSSDPSREERGQERSNFQLRVPHLSEAGSTVLQAGF